MKKLKIKLSRQEICALFDLLFVSLSFVEPVGFKDGLIKEVMFGVLDQLERMQANREQKKFTLKLTGAECIAFTAYTTMHFTLENTPYESVLINRINSEIFKTHSNATHI